MHNNHPLFSIIIPTYNRAEKLRRAMESVEKQTFKDFEVIVCDDGSMDNTKSVVDSFEGKMKVTYLWEENWGGPARPRNNGLRVAQGEWVCFLDADDWWYPDKLAAMLDHIKETDVLYHDSDIYTESRGRHLTKMLCRQLRTPAFVDMMTKGNPLVNSSVCVRKNIVAQVGFLSEDKKLISVEDFDLWLRISRVTERFKYISRSFCGYWIGEGNLSKSPDFYIAKHLFLYDKFMAYLTENDRREAVKYLAYCIGVNKLANGMFRESRKQFYISMKSRNTGTISKSIIRIIMSFLHKPFYV
jgi:glycosyltransferase involved in cell wall biosynthesis